MASRTQTELGLRHRRRRLGRAAPSPTGSAPTRRRPSSCSRRATPTSKLDPFIHMPAALPDPDRQPALRLEVRVGARAVHGRPPGLPRPRQGARRLEQHQRDDLPARQPARLRALGRRPGHGDVGLPHCLPYFKRMETCLAGADEWRGGSGPLILERGPATNPLFGAFFEAAQQAGYPLTDDVNGYRQEGFARFDRNVHRGRRLSAARAYLHPVMNRPNLRVETLAHVTGPALRGQAGSPASTTCAAASCTGSVDAKEVILCGGAINSPQLLQLSGVGNAAELEAARHHVGGRPARSRREPPGPPRGLHPVRLQAARLDRAVAQAPPQAARSAWSGCSSARVSAPSNHFEAGGFVRSNDDWSTTPT